MNYETPLNMAAVYQKPYQLVWECAAGDETKYVGETQLALDLGIYSLLLIVMKCRNDPSDYITSHLMINDSSIPHKYIVNISETSIGHQYRTVEITNTGLTFGPTYRYCNYLDHIPSCYPYRIYGIQ